MDQRSKEQIEFVLDRLDTAIPEQERAVLHNALVLAHKQGWLTDNTYDMAMAWLNAGAVLSAAEALIPKDSAGFELVTMHRTPSAFVQVNDLEWNDSNCQTASTAALALASAAIRGRLILEDKMKLFESQHAHSL